VQHLKEVMESWTPDEIVGEDPVDATIFRREIMEKVLEHSLQKSDMLDEVLTRLCEYTLTYSSRF
jgi:hypothetical protein